MAKTHFEQDIFIQASPEKVRSSLATLENHHTIHPLIVDVRLLKTTTTPDGGLARHYAVRDRMRVGPMTMKFTYQAIIHVNQSGEVIAEAIQFPRIRLLNITRCLPAGVGTRVIEQVNIDAPRLLIKTVYEQARRSHQEMLQNLRQQLE